MIRLAKEYFADQRNDNLNQLGVGLQRSDVPGHVTGKTAFFADRNFPRMLHLQNGAQPARSRAHQVDRTSEAESIRASCACSPTRTCRRMCTRS